MENPPPHDDLETLLPSWELALRAERKSPATITSYRKGVVQFVAWAKGAGVPAHLDRRTVRGFLVYLMDEKGVEPNTAVSRLRGLRRMGAWMVEEGELEHNPVEDVKPPTVPKKVVEPLADDEVRALLATCKGTAFPDRRDDALIRFMAETGARAAEALSLAVADVDLLQGVAVIRSGKGGKGRVVPYSSKTAQAMDRYRRARAKHPRADSPNFWLGDRGHLFGYQGLYTALETRSKRAGIAHVHPHRLRHTAAHRWLSAGGSEQGLMAVAGWEGPQMLGRYTKARATDRAINESRNLNLGDW